MTTEQQVNMRKMLDIMRDPNTRQCQHQYTSLDGSVCAYGCAFLATGRTDTDSTIWDVAELCGFKMKDDNIGLSLPKLTYAGYTYSLYSLNDEEGLTLPVLADLIEDQWLQTL